MAQQWWGEHWQTVCGDCQIAFRCGVDHPPTDGRATCPNCGFQDNPIEGSTRGPGQRVEIQPCDATTDPLRRWEVIAFHQPGAAGRVAIKRIVGLPGERVAIRGGDVYANGLIATKSMAELRAVAQPVHDNEFRARSSSPRWQSQRIPSQWSQRQGVFVFAATAIADQSTSREWLAYHHWRCGQLPGARTTPSAVLDNYAYNQGFSRRLNRVTDLLFTCRVQMTDGGDLSVRLHDGWQTCRIELRPRENEVAAFVAADEVAVAPSSTPLTGHSFLLEAAVCDGQLLVGIDRHATVTSPLPRGDSPPSTVSQPIAVAGEGEAKFEIAALRVSRDVHYLCPLNRADDWIANERLGEGEYFVLGDNPADSTDSRHWGPIKLDAVVGRVTSAAGLDAGE